MKGRGLTLSIKKPCTAPGCNVLLPSPGPSRCPKHESQRRKEWADRKPEHASLYTPTWNKARQGYLRSHPFCTAHRAIGKLVPARVVDHVIPHRGDQALFWDSANWQGLCVPCHNAKSAREENERRHAAREGA